MFFIVIPKTKIKKERRDSELPPQSSPAKYVGLVSCDRNGLKCIRIDIHGNELHCIAA
uniref:Uncharacterized protein n=1 Tax=Rhizophora mucronata TaxID=61149 RepID=A0A2P2K6R7_RHIMU